MCKGCISMSILESNLELLSTIPEECQKEIQSYLKINFYRDNPYKPLYREEILPEPAESIEYYDCGEGENFDRALDELGVKYGL